ncbi:MAG: Hpt domain-containing protein, partial [Mastigocoleus sp. MO_167.B18]|nr:Hpt domain-containing protein [Mastigocoleus sp. MO_167.B18]
MLPEQQQRILGYFIEEARDHLNTIEQGLLNLQGTLNDPEMINEVFRAAHSIKGGAAMLGLSSIQKTAHRLEDCFKLLKEHPIQVDQKLESLFLGASDTLKSLLEHLQGPFGLSEEKASELMLEAEPVFKWLQEHLDSLVKEGGVSNKSGTIGVNGDGNNPSTKSNIPLPSTGDGLVNLQNQTLQTLRKMLQLFKQEVTPESRQKLQNCTEELLSVGRVLNLHNWCNLCETAQSAIANPDNSYLVLAKIVITQIKQSLELAVAGRDDEIVVSQELEALVTVPEIDLLEINSPQSNFTPIPVTEGQNLELTSDNVNISNTVNGAELDTSEQVNEIVTDSLTTETSEDINLERAVEVAKNDRLDSDTKIDSQEELHSPTAQEQVPSIPDLSLQFDFDQFYDEEDELELDSSEPPCPEVGIAELNTLADLFEGETPDLEKTWEKEEILDTATINKFAVENDEEQQHDTDSEFIKDILFEHDRSNVEVPNRGKKEDLTLVQLFGDDFLDEEDFNDKQPETSSGELETASQDSNKNFDSEFGEQVDEEIESLLSLTFDFEELESNSEIPTALPTESIAELELSHSQTKNLEELNVGLSDNVELLENKIVTDEHDYQAINSENTLSENTLADEHLILENLFFEDNETHTPQTEIQEDGSIFDEISHENNEVNQNLPVSNTDNWWEHEHLESQNSEIILSTEKDIVEELEANLSVERENVFSSNINNDTFDLEDLSLDIGSEEQFALMFYDEDTNDLFGHPSNEQMTSPSSHDDEFIPQEIHTLSQQPEELELFPEFTGSEAENLNDISESESSLSEEYTDLSTYEMTKLSGGLAFVKEESSNYTNPDIIYDLFDVPVEDNKSIELPATEATSIQDFDSNSGTAELEIYENLDNLFSSDELEEFNAQLNSKELDYKVESPEILSSEIESSEIENPELENPEVLDTAVLDSQIINPEAINPEAINPETINPKTINPETINPKTITPEVPEKKKVDSEVVKS